MASGKLQEAVKGLTLIIGDWKHKIEIAPDMFMRWGTPGQINFLDSIIYVDPDVQTDTFLSVLIHEIIEGMVSRYNLKLSHDVITALEVALFSFLKSNKEFIDIFYRHIGDSTEEEATHKSAEEFLQAVAETSHAE